MKNLASFYSELKFDNPKTFAIVTLVANVIVWVLDFLGAYGDENTKVIAVALSGVLTSILTVLGVRTTRYINTEENDSNTEQ